MWCDVIVTTKNQILDASRDKGYLLHHQDRILVFPDLTPESLQKRRKLKEIIATLREANICHRWVTPLKLQDFHKGKSFYIISEEDGHDLCAYLNLPTPMKTEKPSMKRKLALSSLFPTTNKKPNTTAFC